MANELQAADDKIEVKDANELARSTQGAGARLRRSSGGFTRRKLAAVLRNKSASSTDEPKLALLIYLNEDTFSDGDVDEDGSVASIALEFMKLRVRDAL